MAVEWLDELVLGAGPPFHAMGVRALEGRPWLVADERRDAELAHKRSLLRDRRDVVAAALPSAAAACTEAAAVVAGKPSLEAAALEVQEDLCVLVRRDGHWRLDAGVVCFPSMWRIADKLGAPLAAVHGPVPGYAEELADRVDRFVDRLRPDRPVWRRNWLVHDTDELHLPEAPSAPSGGPLWLRSERQTLRRLPETGAVLFTIRTQQAPLAVLAERPDLAGRMAAAIEAWSPELVAYRGAVGWRDGAVAWLREVAG